MMFKKTVSLLLLGAAAAAAALTGCTSYEIDMPSQPEAPAVGSEQPSEVIYQANPRFFASNDAFKAITARIPDIKAMGCDILWVMPVCTPGELKSVGSPYCIRDFKGLNPRYGSMADFTAMVDAAHAAGMKVVLDWIANHTAWDHAWISEHPDYYAKDAAGNIAQASTWTDVAQLDYSNPDVHTAMADAMMFWIEQGRIDGFRCDYAEGVDHSFWSEFIAKARAARPDLIMLAETSKTDFYDDGFDMIYDWGFAPAMSKAFTGGKSSDIYSASKDMLAKVPEGKSILRYTFNHDTASENSVSSYYGAPEAVPAAYVLTAMLGGTPMIHSSMDADGVSGKLSFFNYTPLTWSADKQAQYAAINSAFKASAETRRGELRTYSDQKMCVFTRSIPGHTLLVIVNLTRDEQKAKTPIALAGTQMTDLINGTTVTPDAELTLPAYGYLVYMN